MVTNCRQRVIYAIMLLAAITAGDVAPGARFTETELGKQLGFSRTPLREAIAALKAEGIVETSEGGSLQVRVLAYHDIHALYEMRATLEGMAARLAATGASPAEKLFIGEIRASEAQLIKNQAPALIWRGSIASFTMVFFLPVIMHFLSRHLIV